MTDAARAAQGSAPRAIPWPDAAGRTAARAVRSAATDAAPSRAAFWLGVLVVLAFSNGWVMFVTGPDGDPNVGSLVIAGFVPAYLAAAWLLATGGRASWRAALAAPPVWALVLLAVASVSWSVAPQLTSRRTPALILTTVAGFALAARFGWARLAEVLGAAFAVLVVGSFLLAVAVPSWGRMTTLFPGAWRGLWNEKNALGDHMTAGVCVLVAAAVLNPARRRLWTGFALGALALIVLSTSKTSLVTLMVGMGTLVLVAGVRRGGVAAVAAVFTAVVGLSLVIGAVLFASDKLFLLLGKDPTLTGRTIVWAAAERLMVQSPRLGFGYGAVWDDPSPGGPIAWIVKAAHWRPHHAHNVWIELRLALGWAGFWAFVLLIAQAWARLVAALARGGEAAQGAWLVAPFLSVWTFQSLTESIGLNYNDFSWVMLVAMAAALGRPRRTGAESSAAP